MLKKIFSYGFIEGIAKGLNKLIFLILPFLLTTENFGIIGLIISVELIIPFITLLGFDRAVLRFHDEKLNGFVKTIFKSILYVHIFLFLIGLIVYAFGVKTVFGLKLFPDIFLILFLVYFQGRNQLRLNLFRIKGLHKDYFRMRLLLQVGKLLFVLILVYYFENYLSYLIGGLIVSVLVDILYTKNTSTETTESFNRNTFKVLFMFSWPLVFHGLAGNILGNADKFIIERFMTLNDVGLYTFVYSVGSMMVFAFVGVSIYIEPLLYKQKSEIAFENLLKKYIIISLLFGLVAFFILSMISIYIFPNIYKEYSAVLWMIPYIAIAYILYPFYLTSNYRMIYYKKSKSIAVISIISSIINIGLNIILVPKYGIYAAVIVTLITYFIQAIFFTLVSSNYKITLELCQAIILSFLIGILVFYKQNVYILSLVIMLFISVNYIFLKKRKNLI